MNTNKLSVVDALLLAVGLTPTESTGHGLHVRIMRIGPAEARAMLAANKDNRPIRRGRVLFYKRVMLQGGWMLTHQGIAFCVDGRGLDLQHRLTAIAESGVTVDMMVTEGLPAESFEAIDQHERRSMADALRLDRKLTETAKFMVFCRGGSLATNPTTLDVGEVCGQIDAKYQELVSVCNTSRQLTSSAPVRAAAVTLMMENPLISRAIASAYRSLVLDRIEQFTPAMHSLSRQVRSGKVSTSSSSERLDLFARALHALDPARSGLTRISVAADAIEAAKLRVTAVLPEQETA